LKRRLVPILLVAIVFSLKTYAQEKPFKDPYQLISEVLQKAKINDDEKKKHLRFTKKKTTRNLNELGSDGKAKITKNLPLTMHGVGFENDDLKVNINDLLIDRYILKFKHPFPHFQLDNKGRRYYEIDFRPKPDIVDAGNEYVRVANRLNGSMYIDSEYLYVTRVTAEMPLSTAFTTHVFGQISWVEIEVLQSYRSDLRDLVVIDYTKSNIKYKILWLIIPRSYFEQYEIFYDNYTYIP
jgi:hypothetical protein